MNRKKRPSSTVTPSYAPDPGFSRKWGWRERERERERVSMRNEQHHQSKPRITIKKNHLSLGRYNIAICHDPIHLIRLTPCVSDIMNSLYLRKMAILMHVHVRCHFPF